MTSGGRPSGTAPAPPAVAGQVFGERVGLAEHYAQLLVREGVPRGLIGPREADRLWERHLLNCAVLTDFLPADARVVDVGSGAGLPGIAMAIRRSDLQLDLVEPMQRRTDFLGEVIAELGLAATVRVIRGRADDPVVADVVGGANWVVARAVAPLDRLVRWCLPLLASGGRLLALKGAGASDEVAAHRQALRRLGAGTVRVRTAGAAVLAEPARVVVVERRRSGPERAMKGRG